MADQDWGDSENPHTFEEAVAYLTDVSRPTSIDYEVSVGGHQGALMAREVWLEAVKDESFIDYDGYGNQLTAEGSIIGSIIKPSQADTILPDTAYILWYNR